MTASNRRIGIIGLGMAAAPHARALHDLAGRAEVAAVYSPTRSRRDGFAEEHGWRPVSSVEAVLDDPSIGVVMILTPPNTHLQLVEAAAAHGKNIILEKPLEISLENAEALVESCRRHGVALGVVFQNRYRGATRALLRIVEESRLGQLIAVAARVDNWRTQGYYDEPGRGQKWRDGGGVLLTQAIHTIDLLVAIAGLPRTVFGHVATSPVHKMETEDVAAAVLQFSSGVGTLNTTTAAYPGRPEVIDVIGTNGTARLSGDHLDARFQDGTSVVLGAPAPLDGAVVPIMTPDHMPHRALIADFLDAVEAGRPVPVSGDDAMAAQRVVEAVLRSSAEQRAIELGLPSP